MSHFQKFWVQFDELKLKEWRGMQCCEIGVGGIVNHGGGERRWVAEDGDEAAAEDAVEGREGGEGVGMEVNVVEGGGGRGEESLPEGGEVEGELVRKRNAMAMALWKREKSWSSSSGGMGIWRRGEEARGEEEVEEGEREEEGEGRGHG
ncbi:uncharacterized protein LOC121779049 [Salvia splendens]|uniref:uncharacterized protein LOC121779049 n=1 Tax=Salvia splendens TaxID=180675 RepID=UPI001C265D32|nr:uncharacterized protein LOC121779049 [Salvia splendens]